MTVYVYRRVRGVGVRKSVISAIQLADEGFGGFTPWLILIQSTSLSTNDEEKIQNQRKKYRVVFHGVSDRLTGDGVV